MLDMKMDIPPSRSKRNYMNKMLENPRNTREKEFDVYVLDEVFPEDEHKDFLNLIRELKMEIGQKE